MDGTCFSSTVAALLITRIIKDRTAKGSPLMKPLNPKQQVLAA